MSKVFNLPQIVIFTVFSTFMFSFGNLSGGVNSPNLQFYAKDALGISVGTLGILFSLSNTVSGAIRIPTGLQIDRHGTKRYLTIAYGVSAVALLIALSLKNWLALAVAMALSGAGTGMMFCTQKFRLAHYTNSQNRSAAYSMLFGFSFVSSFLGPYISGVLMENYGFHLPVICGLAITIAGMFLSFRLPPIAPDEKPPIRSKPRETTTTPGCSSGQITEGVLSRSMGMGRNVWLITFYKTSYNAISGATSFIYALYLRETFSLSYELTGTIMTFISLPRIVGIISAGRVRSTEGRKKLLLLSIVEIPLFFIGFRVVSNILQATALIVVLGFIGGHITPTMDAVLADSARSSQVGLSFGIYDMCMRIGIAVGNIFGGFMVDQFGYVAALSTAGLIAIIPSFFSLVLLKTRNSPP